MTPEQLVLIERAWRIVGWTMIHYLWVGAILGLAAAAFRVALRRAAPSVRYAVSLMALATLASSPVAIALLVAPTQPVRLDAALLQPAKTPTSAAPIELKAIELKAPEATPAPPAMLPSWPEQRGEVVEEPIVSLRAKTQAVVAPAPLIETWLARGVQSAPWVWLIGAPLMLLWLFMGLAGGETLRRGSHPVDSPRVAETLDRLRAALRVGRRVGLAVCDRVAQPVLVGVVRPLILLPPTALAGWSPEQLEMVLLHELAHVRRWDNLVNLMQRLVESLLFFHPAVWVVSGWVRRDREECCDAVVVAHTGQPVAYAEVLVAVAASQSLTTQSSFIPLSAMARFPLGARVRRILKLEDEKMLITRKAALGVVSMVAAAAALLVWLPTAPRAADPSPDKPLAQGERQWEPSKSIESIGSEIAKPTKPAEKPTQNSTILLTFDEQQVADRAYRMLGVELEPLNEQERNRVEKLGFSSGLKVVDQTPIESSMRIIDGVARMDSYSPFKVGDLLVGLHSWATTDLAALNQLLERPDLKRLNPLKFYVVRRVAVQPQAYETRGGRGGFDGGDDFGGGFEGEFGSAAPQPPVFEDRVIRGRIVARIDDEKPVFAPPTPSPPEAPKYAPGPSSANREAGEFYDGKTFEHWRTMWRTELKAEKRLECVEALAAFGRNGRAQEAAETILDVAGEYDFAGRPDDDSLKKGILEALAGEPGINPQVWLDGFLKRYEREPNRWSELAYRLISRANYEDEEQIEKVAELALAHPDPKVRLGAINGVCNLKDAKYRDMQLSVCKKSLSDENDEVALLALKRLQRIADGDGMIWVEEYYPTLFHRNLEVRKEARGGLRRLTDKDAPAVTQRLLADLEKAEDQDKQIAAIRALAAIGQKAKPLAKEKLMAMIAPGTSEEVLIAAAYAADRMGDDTEVGSHFGTRSDGTMALLELRVKQSNEGVTGERRSWMRNEIMEEVREERQEVR